MKPYILALLVSLPGTAAAEAPAPEPAPASPFHLDVEVDPTAYAFSGYSVHVGPGYKHLRLDLGIFAMDLPEFFHGNAGWNASFAGAGAKLQWFPLREQRALFVDVSGGVSRQTVTWRETGASRTDTGVDIGVSAGWRFALPYRFYATPWIGLSYDLASSDVMLDGHTFDKPKVFPFAAVHVGYRFR